LYPRSGDKNTTSRAFRSNLLAAPKGFPLLSGFLARERQKGADIFLNLLTVGRGGEFPFFMSVPVRGYLLESMLLAQG
jgi:hypothetical protein